MSNKKTKSQKRNTRKSLKRKKRHDERIDIRKMDELVQVALIEDDTWDAMCYKDSCLQEDKCDDEKPSFFSKWLPWIIKKTNN